jgi:hypothetical protein
MDFGLDLNAPFPLLDLFPILDLERTSKEVLFAWVDRR